MGRGGSTPPFGTNLIKIAHRSYIRTETNAGGRPLLVLKGHAVSISMSSLRKIWLFGILNIILTGSGVSLVHADGVDGIGKLKFGMKPSEVESLEGCSNETQCLYEILGKNRYFNLFYEANDTSTAMASPPPTAALTTRSIFLSL